MGAKLNTLMQQVFETFYYNDSEYARTGKGPLLNQPNSVGTITRAPKSGFKGNEGFGAPEDLQIKWPTLKKKKSKATKKLQQQNQQNRSK